MFYCHSWHSSDILWINWIQYFISYTFSLRRWLKMASLQTMPLPKKNYPRISTQRLKSKYINMKLLPGNFKSWCPLKIVSPCNIAVWQSEQCLVKRPCPVSTPHCAGWGRNSTQFPLLLLLSLCLYLSLWKMKYANNRGKCYPLTACMTQ